MGLRLLEHPVALEIDATWGTPKRITLCWRTQRFAIQPESSPLCPICGHAPEPQDRYAVMIYIEYGRPVSMAQGSNVGTLVHAFAHYVCVESLPETGEPDWVAW